MEQNLIVQTAQQALLYEVVCWPKPGLVDPIDEGSHPDMDVFLFLDSSVALLPYFNAFFEHGKQNSLMTPHIRMRDIRDIGIQAEQAMFEATNQINTHKGAIFSLGIFLNSLGALTTMHEEITLSLLQRDIKEMTQEIISEFEGIIKKPDGELTFGEVLYKEYGLLGVRGQAYRGYPDVFEYGLPFYQEHQGDLTRERLVDTLLYLTLHLEDTTLIKRSHRVNIQNEIKSLIERYFELGASNTDAGKRYLDELNVLFKEENWSLGGCADMLILIVFLSKLLEKKVITS